MKLPSLVLYSSLVVASFAASSFVACGGTGGASIGAPDGGASSGGGVGSGGSTSSGGSVGGGSSGGGSSGSGGSGGSSSSGSGSGSGSGSSGGSSGGDDAGSSSGGSDGGGSSGGPFAAGTICNSSGTPRTPPATIKNLIVILEENENYGNVQGSAAQAPYINSLAAQCGVATAYNDNCFSEYIESLPHYLALTSGSNCDTGTDESGTSCVTYDETNTSQGTLSTVSIFQQATSWKSYQEDMPSACDTSTPLLGEYVLKHNPAALYTNLTSTSSCTGNDLAIAALSCNTTTTMTSCGTPSNAFTQDLANDTLAQFTFVTPDLLNDMHDGTITEADNWLYTYLPLIFASPAYLRGDVALFVLWDQQDGITIDGPTPNVFISPYITAGTVTSTPMNHYAVLRSFEEALGISTYLGCASGNQPGGGACPSGSTTEVRAALNF